MTDINIKVKKIFDKKLGQLNLQEKLSDFELKTIMQTLQNSYDLGHADGFAEGFYENYNK